MSVYNKIYNALDGFNWNDDQARAKMTELMMETFFSCLERQQFSLCHYHLRGDECGTYGSDPLYVLLDD